MFTDSQLNTAPANPLEDYIRGLVQEEIQKAKAQESKSTFKEVTLNLLTGDLPEDHNLWPDGKLVTLGQIAKAKDIPCPQQTLSNWKRNKGLKPYGGTALNTLILTDDIKHIENNKYSRKTSIKTTRELQKGRVKL